jgi:hypothetical protein
MLSRSPKVRLLSFLLSLALLGACNRPEPTTTVVAQAATLVPTFTPTALPTATRTTTPTSSPSPSPPPSPTDSPTPTATATPSPVPPTNTATDTPTLTPTATATDTATAAPPTPTRKPKPPTSTPVPSDGFDFDITMQRMLSIEENGGVVGNHNIFVHVYDANGNPLNGVIICRVYALQLQPPDPHACGVTGETGEGRMHFDVYAGDIIYVATADPDHRPRSPYTRALEQEPAAMTNLQELVDNGYCASVEDCQARIPINNLVRFHYSYEVHFQRRW